MFVKPKANAEFEDEYDTIVPKEGEVRVVANRNRECQYYYLGIGQCRKKMLKIAGDPASEFNQLGFLPCKRLVDAHYRCLTEDKYGYTTEEIPEEAKKHYDRFMECSFKELRSMQFCRQYFDAVLRELYRQPDTKVKDWY